MNFFIGQPQGCHNSLVVGLSVCRSVALPEVGLRTDSCWSLRSGEVSPHCPDQFRARTGVMFNDCSGTTPRHRWPPANAEAALFTWREATSDHDIWFPF